MARRSDEDAQKRRASGARPRPIQLEPARPVAATPRLADDHDDEDDSIAPRIKGSGEPLPENERAFGRYTLLRRLAYGGMGEVFLARQGGQGSLSEIAKLVVIKRILAHVKRDERHRRMFLDEARLQALLNSPHIVHVHDMGEENGHVYLAMEHVHGPSWRAIVDRARQLREQIPLAYICEMVSQCARGLSYAHNLVDVTGQALRIVHRDINPQNVLVSYDGEVKIIDFGIAKSELGSGHTETGTIKGKFQYMSPEQSAAEKLDKRSDLFTLGICLYELVALDNPFRRGNVVLSLEAIQKDDPPPLARKRPDAAALDPIVKRSLMKHRADRYTDGSELADALDDLVASGAVPAPPAPLSVWLRERFSVEIAEHLQILEATGSQMAMVARGRSDSQSVPRPRTKVERRPVVSIEDPTNPNHDNAPFAKKDKSLDIEVDPSAIMDASDDVDPTGPVGLEGAAPDIAAAPTMLHDVGHDDVGDAARAGPLPHDLTATTPAPALLPAALEPAPVAEAPRTGGSAGVWLALGVLVLACAGALAFLAFDPLALSLDGGRLARWIGLERISPDEDVHRETPRDPGAIVVDAGGADAPAAERDAGTPSLVADAGVAPTGSADGAIAAAAVDAGAPSAGDAAERAPPRADVRPDVRSDARNEGRRKSGRAKEPPPREAERAPAASAELAGTLLVTTEGYLVKGNRKLAVGGQSTLRIEGAPFAVTLKVADGDALTVTVTSEPWAIVTVDNVGKGRTPQTLTIAKGKRASIALKNPSAPQMTVGVQLAAP